jgi:hypothetical protein
MTDAPKTSILDVRVDDYMLTVALTDGRIISAPVVWRPRLMRASEAERKAWRHIEDGVIWDGLQEIVTLSDLLEGKPSTETVDSFNSWLATRAVA